MNSPANKRETNSDMPTLEQLRRELAHIEYRQRYYRTLTSTLFTLVVVAACTVLVAMLWLPILEMYGNSMSPTLEEGNIVISVATKEFDRGDIIAFYYGNKLLVKRCIGLPGDVIDIDDDGTVYVNREALDEPYLTEKALGECDISFPFEVPLETFFVLGDHRSVSLDSRNSIVGCIALDQISGKVLFRVWPLTVLGRVK